MNKITFISDVRIIMLGTIRRNGVDTIKYLRSRGLNCEIVISAEQAENLFCDYNGGVIPSWVHVYDIRGKNFLQKMLVRLKIAEFLVCSDIVYSRCLGGALFSRFLKLIGKPYIEQSVGSDMRELLFSDVKTIKKITNYYRNASLILVSQTDHLNICDEFYFENVKYVPLPIDENKFYPDKNIISFAGYEFVIFHPSNHDWTYMHGNRERYKGNNKYRNSSKGNDKLIAAFSRLVKSGINSLLIMLERGIDVSESKALVSKLGIESNVRWLEGMSPDELRVHYSSVNVVADQFDVGSMGLVSLEAMACGAKVLTYLEVKSAQRAYGHLPKILNCKSENDIYISLKQFYSSIKNNENIGDDRNWVLRHHGSSVMVGILEHKIKQLCNSL